jgi:hypothetical protein
MTHYLLGAVVRLAQRLFKGGISKEERGRQRSIAAATAPLHGVPLSPEDAELVAAHHEIVVEYRTGEIPKIVDPPRRPTVREVARKYRRRPKHSVKRHALPKSRPRDPLSDPLQGELEQTVMLPGPPPAWHLESFTTDIWQAAQFRRSGASK